MTLEEAYNKIKELGYEVDSLDVIREVDKYRQYWKPKKVNVILLAESHLFTSDQDFDIKIDYSGFEDKIPNYPNGYVRFVYCFGYAENSMLKNIQNDKRFKVGTPHFWKIFSACVCENKDLILKSTTDDKERIENKIKLLNKLRNKGIWLVDASIVGLYRKGRVKPTSRMMKKIILISWEKYVRNLVKEAHPKAIIFIGKTIHDLLEDEVKKLNIPYYYICQPNYHYFQEGESHKALRDLCSKYCKT